MTIQAEKLANYYENKNIFITGVTGFIGKVCLFKLMSSFPNCGNIYILLRAKKGMTPQQRFNNMINQQPFKRPFTKNKELNSEFDDVIEEKVNKKFEFNWSKVIPVDGDMSYENLGLNDENQKLICSKVNILFNIAASIKFDAPLKYNLKMNYTGVRNLLQLATRIENLVSLVHVSTFYSNSHLDHIEEKVLPMNRDCEKMAEFITWLPDSLGNSIESQIMENRPNTYIFTKAMAENLVQKYEGILPISILRPSSVISSYTYPEPGWVEGVNGPIGLTLLSSIGILRNIDWNYNGVHDVIPCDLVVNSMIAVAERTTRLYPKEIKVYNCSTSSLCQLTWGPSFEILREECLKAPPYKMLRIPIEVPKHNRANKYMFKLTKLSELLFAYFIDFLLILCMQKPFLIRLTKRLHLGYEIMKPFSTKEYTCSNDNLLGAYNELNDSDKEDFNFNPKNLDWNLAFKNIYYAGRKLLLKEDLSNVPAALFKMKIMYAVEFIFKLSFYSIILWTGYKLVK